VTIDPTIKDIKGVEVPLPPTSVRGRTGKKAGDENLVEPDQNGSRAHNLRMKKGKVQSLYFI